jgi:hypothetical protein
VQVIETTSSGALTIFSVLHMLPPSPHSHVPRGLTRESPLAPLAQSDQHERMFAHGPPPRHVTSEHRAQTFPRLHTRTNSPPLPNTLSERTRRPHIMAPTLYPRSTVKKIVKAHANRPLSKNVDILIYLNYALFMQEYVLDPITLYREEIEEGKRRGRTGCGLICQQAYQRSVHQVEASWRTGHFGEECEES